MKDADDDDEEDDDEEEEAESSGEENGDCEENGADKPAVKRDGTMVVTATVRSSSRCFPNQSFARCNYKLISGLRSSIADALFSHRKAKSIWKTPDTR